MVRLLLVMCGALLAAVVGAHADAPTTLYIRGNIHTMDPGQPRAEAMAVREGRIVAVGSEAHVLEAISDAAAEGSAATRVDLAGRTVLPGLIDSHGHMTGLGAIHLNVLDLSGTRTYEEIIEAVAARVAKAKPGEWIQGRGWDHESWPERQLPTHEALSRVSPNNPVILGRVDGHAALANAAAMQAAGVNAQSTSPEGGEILRDPRGSLTGVFVDNAMDLLRAALPSSARGNTQDMLLKAQELCLSAGVTGVHDAGVGEREIEAYQAIEASGRLKLRVYAMVRAAQAPAWFEKHGIKKGEGRVNGHDERLTIRSTKMYVDGALGSRGAWLLEPYADRSAAADGSAYTGLAVGQPAEVEKLAAHALKHGYQVCTHAIGDRGNREVLDAYSRAMKAAGGVVAGDRSPRFRVEHAQVLAPADIPRFRELGVIAAMQATHATSDMRWAEARVGPERAKGAYAWASLLASGAVVAGGSDFPVESHNPFLGLYAAVTRQNAAGEPAGGWMPQERMTREEALRSYTAYAAYAGFAETLRGTLSAGKQADFIVIDRDVMVCEPREILGTKVLMTVVGGEVVWEGR
ncbi:MAG: amidohydrolase [Phycisphaerales bacterium]